MVGDSPTTLILGSLPGDESLRRGEYYANARNLFWDIMQSVLDVPMNGDYESRCAILKSRGIALWDVIGSAIREGSLDSSISDEQYNDLASFLEENPTITTVVLNGGKAQKAFRKYLKATPGMRTDLNLFSFPSTSRLSITAGWSPERITDQWKTMITCQEGSMTDCSLRMSSGQGMRRSCAFLCMDFQYGWAMAVFAGPGNGNRGTRTEQSVYRYTLSPEMMKEFEYREPDTNTFTPLPDAAERFRKMLQDGATKGLEEDIYDYLDRYLD